MTATGLPGLNRVLIWFNDPGNWWGPGGLLAHIREHVVYTAVIIAVSIIIAVPLGVWIGHTGRGILLVGGVANSLRAIPSLGLLVVLIVELSPHVNIAGGAGGLVPRGSIPYFIPALIVLLILAIPPVLTNTYAGVQAVDPAVRDAARGSGMTATQTAVRVELPNALPLVIGGIRSATLQVIASLTVAAYAPLVGGLGRLIVDGDQNVTDPHDGYPAMVAAGITVAVLAVAVDAVLNLVQRRVVSPGISGRYRLHTRGVLVKRILALTIAAVALLAACGRAGSSDAPVNHSSSAGASVAAGPLPAAPGSVTIGSADFPENELLADIYADALRAKGVKVSVHANIGERPAYLAALSQGSIGAVPEYSGAILDWLDKGNPARSPAAVYAQLQTQAAANGFAVTKYAPAQDVDSITVTKATATKYHLRGIADLKSVASKLSLGAPAPFQTVSYGTPALAKTYGVTFGRFVPLAPTGSITQTALRHGTVDAADIFSTDPSILKDDFVSLTDPQHIFAAENVVPLFKRSILTQPMADAANDVSAKLTTNVLTVLDTDVAAGADPATVASKWLKQQGLS
jgi:glycine betaine/choline ABC-type transport system substrate-binding protein/ABC-type proline/glycine betaine transport system permease subunit